MGSLARDCRAGESIDDRARWPRYMDSVSYVLQANPLLSQANDLYVPQWVDPGGSLRFTSVSSSGLPAAGSSRRWAMRTVSALTAQSLPSLIAAVLLKTKAVPLSLASAFRESGVDGASLSDLRRLVEVGSAVDIENAIFAIAEGCVRRST